MSNTDEPKTISESAPDIKPPPVIDASGDVQPPSDAPPADPNASPPTGEHANAPPADPKPPEPPAPASGSPSAPKMEAVPFEPRDTAEMFRLAQFLAKSSLIPKALIGKPSDVFLVLYKGHDLGLRPMQSIGSLNVIDGKVELAAQLMVSLILKSGLCEYWRLVESSREKATYVTKRVGSIEVPFTYDIDEAREMGLLDKGKTDWAKENNQWKKQPRTMLRRRAQSNLAREVYPDIILGMYDLDELREQRELEEERMERMGIDPRSVIVPTPPPPQAALAEPNATPSAFQQALEDFTAAPPDLVERIATAPRDPLKERLATKRAKETQTQPGLAFAPNEVGCAGCGVPIVGKSGDKCDACKRS